MAPGTRGPIPPASAPSRRASTQYGQDPVRTASLAYDAVALVAALTKTQGKQRFSEEVLTNSSGFTGIDGLFRFRPDGTNQRGLSVMNVTPPAARSSARRRRRSAARRSANRMSEGREVPEQRHDIPPAPSRRSQRGLDWFVFFLADVQTGFVPFIAVFLTTQKWTQSEIGLALTVGGLVALVGQIPVALWSMLSGRSGCSPDWRSSQSV